jgi:hypothetical protein
VNGLSGIHHYSYIVRHEGMSELFRLESSQILEMVKRPLPRQVRFYCKTSAYCPTSQLNNYILTL